MNNDNTVHIGDYIIIMKWEAGDMCDWSDDFNKTFKVIGFAKDFSTEGFRNHWKDVTEDYDCVYLDSIMSVPMRNNPHFILDKPLSNGSEIIHPIFIRVDKKANRKNKINKLLK